MARMARHARSFWEQRVREVEQGAALEVVARRHGVKPVTLRWWRSALGRDRQAQAALPALLPVVVRSPSSSPSSLPTPTAASIEIAVAGAVVRVAVGTEVGYVALLVGALGGRC